LLDHSRSLFVGNFFARHLFDVQKLESLENLNVQLIFQEFSLDDSIGQNETIFFDDLTDLGELFFLFLIVNVFAIEHSFFLGLLLIFIMNCEVGLPNKRLDKSTHD
jgi:hypothetical protein